MAGLAAAGGAAGAGAGLKHACSPSTSAGHSRPQAAQAAAVPSHQLANPSASSPAAQARVTGAGTGRHRQAHQPPTSAGSSPLHSAANLVATVAATLRCRASTAPLAPATPASRLSAAALITSARCLNSATCCRRSLYRACGGGGAAGGRCSGAVHLACCCARWLCQVIVHGPCQCKQAADEAAGLHASMSAG